MKKRRSKRNDNGNYNPRLKKLILEVVDNQMRDDTPPMTRITFERLVSSGYTPQEAKEKIAAVVVCHIYDIMHDGTTFDGEKYVHDLQKLT